MNPTRYLHLYVYKIPTSNIEKGRYLAENSEKIPKLSSGKDSPIRRLPFIDLLRGDLDVHFNKIPIQYIQDDRFVFSRFT